MPTPNYQQVGPSSAADGAVVPVRAGKLGDQINSELHGRFYEQTYRGSVYGIGCGLTALSAATILLTASAQPIVGVWNPPNSPVNLVILQAALRAALNNVTSVAPGDFIWAASIGNTALTAGQRRPELRWVADRAAGRRLGPAQHDLQHHAQRCWSAAVGRSTAVRLTWQ